MRKLAVLALALVALATAPGCGGDDRPPPAAPRRAATPQWQDAFDGTPELLVVVRPQAIKRDGVYGNLFGAALRGALARAPLSGTSLLEAVEASEEVVVAIHKDESGGEDAAFVLRGVAASLDPGKLVDANGRSAMRLLEQRGAVAEYVPAVPGPGARDLSLFVLPDRTWVAATGGARTRGRQAFATPTGRPAPKLDDKALAVARFGPELVARPRTEKSPILGPLTRKLSSATLLLDPARAGVRLVLAYADDDATAYAEMQVKRIADGLAQSNPKRFGWLAEAKIARGVNAVTVSLPVPPRLLEELPGASPSDLGL